jgi:hypothetical protein
MNKALKSTKCKNSNVVGMRGHENEQMTRTHNGTFGAGNKNPETDENKAVSPKDQDLERIEQSQSAKNEKWPPTGIKNAGSVKNSIGMNFANGTFPEDTPITSDPHTRDPKASGLTPHNDFPLNPPQNMTRTENSDSETSSHQNKLLNSQQPLIRDPSFTPNHDKLSKKLPSKLSSIQKNIYKNNPYYSNLDPTLSTPLPKPPTTLGSLTPTKPSQKPTETLKFGHKKLSIHNENFRMTNPYTAGTTTLPNESKYDHINGNLGNESDMTNSNMRRVGYMGGKRMASGYSEDRTGERVFSNKYVNSVERRVESVQVKSRNNLRINVGFKGGLGRGEEKGGKFLGGEVQLRGKTASYIGTHGFLIKVIKQKPEERMGGPGEGQRINKEKVSRIRGNNRYNFHITTNNFVTESGVNTSSSKGNRGN